MARQRPTWNRNHLSVINPPEKKGEHFVVKELAYDPLYEHPPWPKDAWKTTVELYKIAIQLS